MSNAASKNEIRRREADLFFSFVVFFFGEKHSRSIKEWMSAQRNENVNKTRIFRTKNIRTSFVVDLEEKRDEAAR